MSKLFLPILAGLLLGSLAVTSCGEATKTAAPLIASAPTRSDTIPPSTETLTRTLIPDTGWEVLQPGLERREINLFDENGQRTEYLYILRLDAKIYQFDVAYHPEPQTLDAWQVETGALVVVNGGYFRKENEKYLPNGLTVVNGEAMGSTYDSFGGMLAITHQGPELRWLAQAPYDPTESLRGALQSFPLLVKPGGVMGFPKNLEDHQQARRTVIGQDQDGRILFILTPVGYFTLHQLSAYLTMSDLALEIALNLDGGPSSGLLLSDPRDEIVSYTPLPIVITACERKP